MLEHLLAYIPMDRRHAMAQGKALPEQSTGAALFADISGFTQLTETLVRTLGDRRGAEELTTYLNRVYDALMDELHRWQGSAIAFAGDAITCWFDDHGRPGSGVLRAATAALAMQRAMQAFAAVDTPSGATVSLSMKAAVAAGPVRRFLVGDPELRVLDAMAGQTLARLAAAEKQAHQGDVILAPCAAHALAEHAILGARRQDANGEIFTVLADLRAPAASAPWPPLATGRMHAAHVRPWLLPAVYARLHSGQGEFLAELRPTVALFVRFQGIDYDHDPAAGRKLDAYIRWVQATVDRYQGTLIDLNIGDKGSYLYINFGAPIAHEDDAARAARTALDLLRMPEQLDFIQPVQMGLSQGRMRAGAYGGQAQRTYGVLGAQVNLAARLMMAAQPGQIIADRSVQRVLEDAFTWTPLPRLRVKGLNDAITPFALAGARRRAQMQTPAFDTLPPMVGRKTELAHFATSLQDAAGGNGQIIGVVGSAGIGKSRFVAEGMRLAHARRFDVHGGACEDYGRNASYHVWQPIWRGLFGLEPGDSTTAQVSTLEQTLEAMDPSLRRRAPLLGAVLGLDLPDNDLTRVFEPELRKTSLESLLADVLRALAAQQPRMVVLEECQWLDELSYDLIETLSRALRDVPVLMVLALRPPEATDAATTRIHALPGFRAIELHELGPQDLSNLAHARLAQLPHMRVGGAVHDALLARIVAQAEGNPFYVEELVNFIRHHGIDPSDAAAAAKLDLPNSLQSLVLSRVDQLGELEKTTLRAAAIIGRSFRFGWLAGFYPELGDVTVLQRHLAQLQAFDLVRPASAEPEPTYHFKHIITHEVTYASLPYATRARLHARLAQYLESQVAAGELAESAVLDALAYHYVRTPNHAKQRDYLPRAATAAFRVSAFATARDHLTQLLQLIGPDDPARPALERQLGDIFSRLGDYGAAQTVLQQALAADKTDADRAATQTLLAQISFLKGDYAAARTTLMATVPLARAAGDMNVLCRALSTLGRVDWRLGDMDGVVAAFEEALTLARSIGDVTRELAARNGLGVAYLHADGAKAQRLLTEVRDRAQEVGNRERVMIALANLGVLEDERANDAAARDYHLQALAIARELGTQYYVAHHLSNLAGSEIALGDLAGAKKHNQEALTLAQRLGTDFVTIQALCNTVEIADAEGDREGALALAGLMRRQPAWSSEDTRWLNTLLHDWALDPDTAEAYLAKGDTLDWTTTIHALLHQQPVAITPQA